MKNNLNKKLHYVQSEHNIESLTQFKTGYMEEINEPTKLIAEVIAARDQWWIEKIETVLVNCNKRKCRKWDYCQFGENCDVWESLKKSVEEK